MKTIEESIAVAMDAQQNTDIIPFLPYIFQDFWELGTPPEIVIDLILRHCKNYSNLNILDLGCGKGAVSVKTAMALKCHCYGIDAIPEFIGTAKEKATEYGVDTLCRFETDDIRVRIEELDKFDVIILGATGSIFDDYYTALTVLSKHLTDKGIVIIEEAYIDDASTYQHPSYLFRKDLLNQFGHAGMELIDETACNYSEIADMANEMENISIRCNELKTKYSEKSSLFENYAQKQSSENDALENDLTGSTMVLKNNDINTIIFDIDGTLLDTEYAMLSSLRDTIIELKSDNLELSELSFALGIPGGVALQKLRVKDVDNGNTIWNENLLKYSHTIKLFDGIEDVINKLKSQGYKLGVITSKTRNEYINDFVPFGLDSYFDTVICVEDSIRPKPHPEPIIKYLEVSGTRKEEVVYIGDTAYDMLCASDAGVKFGLALWGCHSHKKIHADYYFDVPKDILTKYKNKMKNQFKEALVSNKPNQELVDKLNLFGQFVGDWDFEWVDGKETEKERHIKGEWLFSWILDGTAIQDVFICPSRSERLTNKQPDAIFGTTLRIYNPQTEIWNVCFGFYGCMVTLEAQQENEKIVVKMQHTDGFIKHWIFSDITANTFHWEDKMSLDNGITWIVTGELFATRKR